MEQNSQTTILCLNLGGLSHIFTFLELGKNLDLRRVCKQFNKAVWYGWRLRINELGELEFQIEQKIRNDFDKKTIDTNFELKANVVELLTKINRCSIKAQEPTFLFPTIQNIGFLLKPCRVLIVPLLTSIILMGWKLPKPNSYDFSCRDQLKKIWALFRIQLRNKNYYKYKYLKEFEIDNVRLEQVALVRRILKQHQDMQFAVIQRECNTSAWMFLWTQKVLEYFDIKTTLRKLGVKELEDKIQFFKDTSQTMATIFEGVLKEQKFDS